MPAPPPLQQPVSGSADPALNQALERLRVAELRIQLLETERLLRQPDSSPPMGPLEALWNHWRSVGDPEIITAAQQMGPAAAAADEKGTAGTGSQGSEKKLDQPAEATKEEKPKKWYDKLSIRGYTQVRLNEVPWEAVGSFPAQYTGDSSVGEHQNFLIRRARLILSGDVSEHLFIYLQPDFAVNIPGVPDANHFAQIRDWYADCYFDVEKVWRVRVGQSKVPYGWENLQSSSNRVPLDRTDGLNSAVRNERDLGVFFYWTPEYAQQFFKDVLEEGLKGSGNYGVFGLGVYNGQGGSLREQNDNLHLVSRLTIPMTLESGQRLEVGLQAYTGKYTVLSSPISPLGDGPTRRPIGTLETLFGRAGFRDERLAGSFIWYPQPLGLQVEWNVGKGPSLNDAQTEIIERSLSGGYVMLLARCETFTCGTFYPFARYHRYRGGYKPERNAPYARVDEIELGSEWQITPQMELTFSWAYTDRTNTTAFSTPDTLSYGQFIGQLLRVQFQFNY